VRFGDAGGLPGIVESVDYLGTTQVVAARTAFGLVRGRTSATSDFKPDQAVRLSFLPDRLALFDGAGGRNLYLKTDTGEVPHG
jgi:hypothetical protein